jgi:hypothetical protein
MNTLTKDPSHSIITEFNQGFLSMLDQTSHNKRSIVDEIREDLALDNYYRRLENRCIDSEYDEDGDSVIEFEYEFKIAE